MAAASLASLASAARAGDHRATASLVRIAERGGAEAQGVYDKYPVIMRHLRKTFRVDTAKGSLGGGKETERQGEMEGEEGVAGREGGGSAPLLRPPPPALAPPPRYHLFIHHLFFPVPFHIYCTGFSVLPPPPPQLSSPPPLPSTLPPC